MVSNLNLGKVSKVYKLKEIVKKISDRGKKLPVLNYLETHLTDHCNLNCKACNHFCPISEKKFNNINVFSEDLNTISRLFNIKKLRLLGGEPLLHPEIKDFIKSARKILPDCDIRIVSNGTLIKTMTDDFWECCRDNNITFDLSKYPIVKNFDEIIRVIKLQNVNVGHINEISEFWVSLNPAGDSDMLETFQSCECFRDCVTLYNGKIYKCPIGAYIYKFNNYYRESIPEETGVDINKSTAENILNYLDTPMETCKFCFMPANKWDKCKWSLSKKDKYECFNVKYGGFDRKLCE